MSDYLNMHTDRLQLRPLTEDDATSMYHLMNDSSWLQFIGDRGIRTIDDAREYIQFGPMCMYRDKGVGILAAEQLDTGQFVGTCGLLYREQRQVPDLGFAFLPQFRRQGYARECSTALIDAAQKVKQFSYLDALVSPGNTASIALLSSLGFEFHQPLPEFDPDKDTHCYRLPL